MKKLASTDLTFYALVGINVVLYGMMVVGFLRGRVFARMPKVRSAGEAFAFLEGSFKARFPEVRDGFTWSEAISKAKKTNSSSIVDWKKVEAAVNEYEAYRYGQRNEPSNVETEEILKLGV